ncbi:MAG TPA: phenylalanine--tRNA ligase subunit alpha [Thermoanaerobaculia bacterium]|jgi:phenylalanyl-tRNA synthetase alpha chain|nr:phenylalanine--tRNA ligase subunit alpha [Thermoanaerobaculia bacterium]
MSNPINVVADFQKELASASTPEELATLRVKYLGKKSYVKTALKSAGSMPADVRPVFAKQINDAQSTIEKELDEATERIKEIAAAKQIEAEWQDLTLPGIAQERGSTHPLTQVHKKAMDVMRRLGFTLEEGPEIETPYYNFDALNIPENHPARDMQDTFWLPDNHLLRSHTTTVQARVLEQHPPLPIKVVAAGRVYRNEAVDATHLAMFHQFEGIWVEEGLTYGDLKGTLLEIARSIYGEGHEFRFKPKYYPYTEPSVGMDMQCTVCFAKDENCPACRGAGWITILGSGMIHPKVFIEFGYDHTKLSGIAFGIGTTRIAAQAAGLTALKPLYEQDLRVHRNIYRGGL